MDTILTLTQINYSSLILGLLALLFICKEIIEILNYFKKRFRLTCGAEQDKNSIEQRITTLEKHDNWQYEEILKMVQGINDINKRLLDKEIDDIRWEILDFSSALTSGRKFSKEQFDHVISTHEKYIRILEENGLTNGLVSSSMEVIQNKYKDCLMNGF